MDDRRHLIRTQLRRLVSSSDESALEGVAVGKEALRGPHPDVELEAAFEGWRRVEADEEVTDAQFDALEAIVLPMYRPVIDIVNDSFTDTPQPWELLNQYKNQIETASRSIGRVELSGHPWLPYGGTGSIVGPNLLMTNRHVAELFVMGLGIKDLMFFAGRGGALDFKREVIPSEPVLIKVRSPRMIHPYWDVAILEVEKLERQPLHLASTEPVDAVGRRVVVLGYPAMDSRNDADLQNRIFRGAYGIKRLQPGTITGYGKVRSYDHTVEALNHDCSTLGGNSGSALLDLETGEVLGLHFAGVYLKTNYAIPAWQLACDAKFLDLGVQFTKTDSPATRPEWINVWSRFEVPAVTTPKEAPAVALTGDKWLRVGADWFERTSDEEIAIALREDPVATRALLARTLRPEEVVEIEQDLGAVTQEGLFWQSPNPTLPEIVFLHGIMGGHLADLGRMKSRVWLNPFAFIRGNIAEALSLMQDGERDAQNGQTLQPDGHLRMAYGRASRRWRTLGFVVHQFSFDWRKSVAYAADRSHHFLENLHLDRPGKMFVLVGHSMGGLVACLYAQRHREWTERIQRAILMGAPIGGSYAAIEAVTGSYPFLQKLALISRHDDLEDLRRMSRTLPGLLDMLPNPGIFPDADQMYSQSRWPDEVAPDQRWLDQSRNLKPLLTQSPLLERTTLLVSLNHGTVHSVVEQNGSIWRGERTGVGDGTVPGKSAVIGSVAAYKVDYDHSRIARDPKAIQAVDDLVKSGRCSLDRVHPEDLSDDIKITEVPAIEFPEGAAAGIRQRFETGVFTQEDLDWLMSPNISALPQDHSGNSLM